MFFGPRATDEPFSGLRRDGLAARHARDHDTDTAERRARSDAQSRHALRRWQRRGRHAHFAASFSMARCSISTPRARAPALRGLEGDMADMLAGSIAPLLVEQLVAMGFDALTVRQGTLHVTTAGGASETIGDIQAELTGRRKGQVTGKGSFTIRGQRLAFDGALAAVAREGDAAALAHEVGAEGRPAGRRLRRASQCGGRSAACSGRSICRARACDASRAGSACRFRLADGLNARRGEGAGRPGRDMPSPSRMPRC